MAYGDWGAWVYKNGERQPTHEDAIPYHEEDLPSGSMSVLTVRTEGLRAHHAVLGKDRLRWCGHKSTPVLYVDSVALEDQELRRRYASHLLTDEGDGYLWETNETIYQGEIDGYRFRAKPFDGNMIDLELIEPDGDVWQARSGYAFGNGFASDSEGNVMYDAKPWIDQTPHYP